MRRRRHQHIIERIEPRRLFGGYVPAPATPDLLAGSDTGLSSSDNTTRLNNSSQSALQFRIGGTVPGATVTLYGNEVPIGSAAASGSSTTVTTDAMTPLADGSVLIMARQSIGEDQSLESSPLNVTIDTIAPPAPAKPDLQSTSDTGLSDSDNFTSVTTPTFDLLASEAGVVLHLETDGSMGTGPSVQAGAAGVYAMKYASSASGFLGQAQYSTNWGSQTLAVADFNSDGLADVAITIGDVVYAFTANSSGTFNSPVILIPSQPPRGIVASDFNGDGKIDLALATNETLNVFMGNGNGTFQTRQTYNRYPGFYLHTADVNGDGFADLISSASTLPPSISVWLGVGDGSFPTRQLTAVPNPGSTGLYDLALGDFNGDGKLDVIASNGDSGVVYIPGIGDGTFGSATLLPLGVTNVIGTAVADMNGDGKLDIIAASSTSNSVYILAGNGDGTFQSARSFVIGAGKQLLVADFNRDGLADVAATNYGGANVSVALGNGDGTLRAASSYTVNSAPFGIAAGDFNGDGRIDLAAAASSSSKALSVLLATGGNLTDGAHAFSAWAEDSAGNRSDSGPTLVVGVDTGAPAAALPIGQTPTAGAASFDFNVRFDDYAGVDVSTIAPDGIRVTGPNGFDQVATLVGLDVNSNGSPRTATYRISAPGGVWESFDNGMYAVIVQGAQVQDVAGNRLGQARTAGEFAVNLPFAVLSEGGVLFVNGGAGNDNILLQAAGGNLTAYRTGPPRTFPSAAVSSIVVQGLTGDDTFLFSGPIAQPLTYRGGSGRNTLEVQNGTFTFGEDPRTDDAVQTVYVDGGAAVNLTGATTTLESLTVYAGGRVSMAPDRGALRVNSLALDPAARLDLADNALIVDYTGFSPIATVNALIQTGYNGGWSGNGIVTTLASGKLTGLAIAEAAAVLGPSGGAFDGQSVDASAVLVRYTYGGDANLDGKLNIDDYGRIDFNSTIPGRTGWFNGDFNYDGTINIDDYGIIDLNVGAQGQPLASAGTTTTAATSAALELNRPAARGDLWDQSQGRRDEGLIEELLAM